MAGTPKIAGNSKLTLPMPDSKNAVAANSTVQFDLPATFRYHALYLECTNLTLALMTEIRLMLNGQVIQRYTAEQREKMNLHDGIEAFATSNTLKIPLDREKLLSRVMRETTAINCGVKGPDGVAITGFKLEVVIGAATNPGIKLSADVSAPVAGGPGDIMRIYSLPLSAQGAGVKQISDLGTLGTSEGVLLSRAFVETSALTSLEVKRDNETLFERSVSLNQKIQKDAGVRAPQADFYAFDPSEEGYGQNMVQVAGSRDFRLNCTLDAGGSFNIILEQMGVLGQ